MAKSIGSLAAMITLDSKAWRRAMRFINAELDGLKRMGAMAGRALRPVATGLSIGATAAAAAATVAVKAQFDSIDSAAKAADRLGLTTEAYSAYRYAADLAGVGTDEFTNSLTRMNKLVAAAGTGNVAAARVLEMLNVDSSVISTDSTEQRFLAIADAINKIPDPSVRVKAAMDVFGRSGAAMTAVVQGGSKALMQQRREADALGITFSRIDAAKLEVANDAITTLQYMLGAVARQAAVIVAPVVVMVADEMQRLGTIGVDAAQRTAKASGPLVEVMSVLGQGIDGIRVVIGGVQYAASWLVKYTLKGVGYIYDALQFLVEKSLILQKIFPETAKAMVEAIDMGRAETEVWTKELEAMQRAGLDLINQGLDMQSGPALVRAYDDAISKVDEMAKSISTAAHQQREFNTELADFRDVAQPKPAEPMALEAIVAGSAQAQRLAFELANPTARSTVPERQLTEQIKTNRHLDRISRQLDEDGDATIDF